MNLLAPELLSPDHQVGSFACGGSVLDEWLKRRALGNQTSGTSRTFVVPTSGREVMGYYALAAGAVTHQNATRSIRQNMPDPVPVMVLTRLAVDVRAQGIKPGAALLFKTPCSAVYSYLKIRACVPCWSTPSTIALASFTSTTVSRHRPRTP